MCHGLAAAHPELEFVEKYKVVKKKDINDASYFKFKTITLSYHLPDKVLKAIKSNSAKVFFSVDNALTLTKYDGYDPEVSMSSGPASAGYGVDFGYQPSLRSYLFGIQIQF